MSSTDIPLVKGVITDVTTAFGAIAGDDLIIYNRGAAPTEVSIESSATEPAKNAGPELQAKSFFTATTGATEKVWAYTVWDGIVLNVQDAAP